MSDERELQEIRQIAQSLVDRAKSDPDFRKRATQDPSGVALAAGLPERALPDFFREQGIDPEVAGHVPRDEDCADFTCIISWCPESCYVTI